MDVVVKTRGQSLRPRHGKHIVYALGICRPCAHWPQAYGHTTYHNMLHSTSKKTNDVVNDGVKLCNDMVRLCWHSMEIYAFSWVPIKALYLHRHGEHQTGFHSNRIYTTASIKYTRARTLYTAFLVVSADSSFRPDQANLRGQALRVERWTRSKVVSTPKHPPDGVSDSQLTTVHTNGDKQPVGPENPWPPHWAYSATVPAAAAEDCDGGAPLVVGCGTETVVGWVAMVVGATVPEPCHRVFSPSR